MSDLNNALPAGGQDKCAQNSLKTYETDRQDRPLLLCMALWCLLAVDTVLFAWPYGIGVTAAVFLWYVLLLAALGPAGLRRRENQVLLVVNLLLGASFALTSNTWFQGWNLMALLVLVPVHAWGLAGSTALPWWRAWMLPERLGLTLRGLFGALGAPFAVLSPGVGKRNTRRLLSILAGLAAAAVLVCGLMLVLASADTLFAMATADLTRFLREHLTETLWKLILALLMTPFLFSLLYRLRRPAPAKVRPERTASADGLAFVIILAALAALYLAFLAVQSAGLFGGPAYLEARGIRYADWARSGFFQMVGVTVVNLTVLLGALTLARPSGRSWTLLRLLAAVLTAESLVLLASAAWRMTLYVSAYGLSFKRCMTYWGMVMMALFFLTALGKVLRPGFAFCRWAFPLALAGWLVINCLPIDTMVAKNQVDRYLSGESRSLSVEYLVSLSYSTLSQLERLSGTVVWSDYGGSCNMDTLLEARRERAAADCGDWRSWNLSACLAASA